MRRIKIAIKKAVSHTALFLKTVFFY